MQISFQKINIQIYLLRGFFTFLLNQILAFFIHNNTNTVTQMIQTNAEMALIQESLITSKSTTMTKQFKIDNILCQYKNTNTVKIDETFQQVPKLIISNYLCKQTGNTLKKVTEIKFGAKTILLTDEYALQIPSHKLIYSERDLIQKSDQSEKVSLEKQNKIKKKQFFKKRSVGHKFQRIKLRRDTKNIVKNFTKTFYKFCEQREIQICIQILRDMMNSHHYNNTMIENIVSNQHLAPHFENFLINETQEWIEKSKIRDKEAHKQAANIYLRLIRNSKRKVSPLLSTQKDTNEQNERSSIEKGSGSE